MTDMIFKTDGEEKFRIPSNKLEIPDSGYLRSPGTVCPKTPLHIREMTSKETIQQLKEDIAILQEKLKKLEEAEKEPDMMLLRQGKVDIVDYDRRTFYRVEYTDSFSGIYKWYEREKTFSNLMPIQDNSEVFVLLEEFYQHQVMKQKEEYPYKKYTPEETEKSLKDAMKKAKEDGVFEKPKPPTLLDIVYEWCDDDNDLPCEELVNRIEEWLVGMKQSKQSRINYDD